MVHKSLGADVWLVHHAGQSNDNLNAEPKFA
jgi:hypothetical protein